MFLLPVNGAFSFLVSFFTLFPFFNYFSCFSFWHVFWTFLHVGTEHFTRLGGFSFFPSPPVPHSGLGFEIGYPLSRKVKLTREWSDPTGRNLAWFFFFFTARVHTTKSSVKILAANTHCKYFLKIAEVTPFSVRGTACIRGLYNLS
jgi:hypothetical protein